MSQTSDAYLPVTPFTTEIIWNPNKVDKKLVRSKSVHRTKRQKEIFNRRLSQKKLKAQLKSWVQNLGLETIFLGAVLIVCDQTWSLTILYANSLDQLLTWEMLRRNCMFQWKWRIAINFHSNITNIIINIISSIWLGYSRSRRWNKQVVCTIRFTRKTTSATLSSPCHRQKKKRLLIFCLNSRPRRRIAFIHH